MMALTRENTWKAAEIMEVRHPWIDSDDEEDTAPTVVTTGQ